MSKRCDAIKVVGLVCGLMLGSATDQVSHAGPGAARDRRPPRGAATLDNNVPTGTDSPETDPPTGPTPTTPPPATAAVTCGTFKASASACKADFTLEDVKQKRVSKINAAIKAYSQCVLAEQGMAAGKHYLASLDARSDCDRDTCEEWTLSLNVGELMTQGMQKERPGKDYIVKTLSLPGKTTSNLSSACEADACDGHQAACQPEISITTSVHEMAIYNRVFQRPDPAGKPRLSLQLAVRDSYHADSLSGDSSRSAMVNDCGDAGSINWKDDAYSKPPVSAYPEVLTRAVSLGVIDSCLYIDTQGTLTLPDGNKGWAYNLYAEASAATLCGYPSSGTSTIPLTNGETYTSSGQTPMPTMRVAKQSTCESANLSNHTYRCGYDIDMAAVLNGNDKEKQACPKAGKAIFANLAAQMGALFPQKTQDEAAAKLIAALNGILYASGILDSVTKSVEWGVVGSTAGSSSRPPGLTFKLAKRTRR